MGITLVTGINPMNVMRLTQHLASTHKNVEGYDYVYWDDRVSDIDDIESFYLIGDCDRGLDKMALTPDGDLIDPNELVESLIYDGLPNQKMDFYVWACYSGDGMNQRKGAAYHIWKAFLANNYKSVRVWGYRKALIDPFTVQNAPSASDKISKVPKSYKKMVNTKFYQQKAKTLDNHQKKMFQSMALVPGTDAHWKIGVSGDSVAHMKIHPPKPLPRPKTPFGM